MEVFYQKKRGTLKELAKVNIGTLIIHMFYPAVLVYYYEHLGEEKAILALKKLGVKLMDDFFKIYNKERNTFQDYIKDFFKIVFNNKIIIKKINKTCFHVIDRKCILCSDIAVEGLPFHYCIPYDGGFERLFEILVQRNKIPKVNYTVSTISSRGTGAKKCIHEITIEEG